MSAPNTDLEKQAKQHRGPLRGMFAAVLFALVLLALLALFVFARGGDPGESEVQVEGSTGDVEAVEDNAVTANDSAEEEASGAVTEPEADPTAVTVPSQTVTAPQSGQSDVVNPVAGDSDTAEPLDPVEGADQPAVDADDEPEGN
jgi:hypothetical protein